MKKLMMIFACIIASIGLSVAQTTRATGTVIDDTGEAVIGASVVAKGTTVGTVTNLDGEFILNVPTGTRTLVISLLGYKPVEIAPGTDLRIRMEPDAALIDEVVVTAMGITRERKSLGYAAQDLNSEDLIKASNPNLAGALQGKVSGVQISPSSGMPGASSKITIRGSRSFSGDNTPLYIVDGMPISSTWDKDTEHSVTGTDFANRAIDIDPNDIESINILKGQAASALYGIRASNGVVVITTRSGKGAKKGKPVVSFSSTVSFDKISRYPQFQSDYAQGIDGEYSPMTSYAWGPKISDLPDDPTYGGNTKNSYTDKDGLQKGKYYVPQRANAGLNPWAEPRAYKNDRDFFETGTTFNNSLNISQATDKSNYSFSLGSTTQSGIIPSTGMDRYSTKLSAESKLTNQWTTGFVGNYVYTSIDKMPTANDGLLATVFGAPPSYDLAGIPSYYENAPYQQNNYRAGSFAQPYWAVDHNKFKEQTSRFFGNAYASFVTKLNTENQKLTLRYQLGTDAYTTNYSDVWGYGNKGSNNTGQIEEYSWSNVTINSLLTATYDWNINQDWVLNVVAGNEFIQDRRKYNFSYGADYNFAGWDHMENTTVMNSKEEMRRKRTVGFFGSINASYKNMLYLTVTGRNDIVSHMPRDNRSFFYPSVSGTFILSEIDGFNKDIVNFAKVRASYAEVGQAGDYYENFYYVPEYGSGFYLLTPMLYPINGVSGFAPYPRIYDPNLKPQNTRSYELGFDVNFLDNLIGLSYTFSKQNVKDQIFDVPLAGSTGAQEMRTNGGKMHTNSHEITLNINPVRTSLIDWSIGANFTKIDNYVDELAPGVPSIFLGGFVTPQVRAGIDDKFPVIYGSSYLRNDNGKIVVDEDGLPMAGDAKVIGSVSPDFMLGFNTNIRIEKLNISAVFDWKSGGEMYSGTNGLLNLYGVGKDTRNREQNIIVDGVKEDGSKNDIEVDKQTYYISINNIDESAIYDTSFLKLRELAVSYPVYKASWLEVTVNAFARNILLWTKLPNLDPESSQGNNNMSGGFERFSLPQTSSYGFGVNVKF